MKETNSTDTTSSEEGVQKNKSLQQIATRYFKIWLIGIVISIGGYLFLGDIYLPDLNRLSDGYFLILLGAWTVANMGRLWQSYDEMRF